MTGFESRQRERIYTHHCGRPGGTDLSASSEFEYELSLFKECLRLPLGSQALRAVRSSRCTAWVASGLSKVAGECGRRTLQDWAGVPGHLFTPLDFCSSNHANYLPILVSYRGKNLDILSVGRSVVEASHRQALLITGYRRTHVSDYLERNGVDLHIISLPPHEEDDRFVAVLATWTILALSLRLAQAAARQAKCEDTDELIESAYHAAEREGRMVVDKLLLVPGWESRKWIVLGGGVTTPAMLAWESMCAEAALSSVIISDVKDYTHGRYLSAMREGNVGFLILSEAAGTSVGRIISRRFSQLFPVIEVNSRGEHLFVLCMHIFLVAFVASGLARSAGYSIGDPPKPAVTKNWRNWGTIKTGSFD